MKPLLTFKRDGVRFELRVSHGITMDRLVIYALDAGEHDEGNADARRMIDALPWGDSLGKSIDELQITAEEIEAAQ